MEIPDDLLCLFTASIDRTPDGPAIEIPASELDQGSLEVGEYYRVAVLPAGGSTAASGTAGDAGEEPAPPVDAGDVRSVEIEGIGDQGDGIARVDRGYVVIVPDTEVGDEVTVEIEDTFPNFAMARVVEE